MISVQDSSLFEQENNFNEPAYTQGMMIMTKWLHQLLIFIVVFYTELSDDTLSDSGTHPSNDSMTKTSGFSDAFLGKGGIPGTD